MSLNKYDQTFYLSIFFSWYLRIKGTDSLSWSILHLRRYDAILISAVNTSKSSRYRTLQSWDVWVATRFSMRILQGKKPEKENDHSLFQNSATLRRKCRPTRILGEKINFTTLSCSLLTTLSKKTAKNFENAKNNLLIKRLAY